MVHAPSSFLNTRWDKIKTLQKGLGNRMRNVPWQQSSRQGVNAGEGRKVLHTGLISKGRIKLKRGILTRHAEGGVKKKSGTGGL